MNILFFFVSFPSQLRNRSKIKCALKFFIKLKALKHDHKNVKELFIKNIYILNKECNMRNMSNLIHKLYCKHLAREMDQF